MAVTIVDGRRSFTRVRGLAAIVLVMAVLAAACGGGGDDKASTRADAPAAPGSGGTEDKATGGGGGGNFCDLVKSQFADLALGDGGSGYLDDARSSDPAVRRRAFEKLKDSNPELLKAAPRTIRGDMETQVRAQEAMIDAQIRGDRAAAGALVMTPEFQAATARVGTYLQDEWGSTSRPRVDDLADQMASRPPWRWAHTSWSTWGPNSSLLT